MTLPVLLLQGVILYGEPGTGKTLLAKAVANSTSATFLRVVGSELIQKYLGDGPKLVRELFRVADELSPSIVFIGGCSIVQQQGRGRGVDCRQHALQIHAQVCSSRLSASGSRVGRI